MGILAFQEKADILAHQDGVVKVDFLVIVVFLDIAALAVFLAILAQVYLVIQGNQALVVYLVLVVTLGLLAILANQAGLV